MIIIVFTGHANSTCLSAWGVLLDAGWVEIMMFVMICSCFYHTCYKEEFEFNHLCDLAVMVFGMFMGFTETAFSQ